MSLNSPSGVQPRGFFFDLTPPTDDNQSEGEDLSAEISPNSAPRTKNHTPISSPGGREWWETDVPQIMSNSKSTAKKKKTRREVQPAVSSSDDFVLSLPEHLPNSPLCPKNPKHTSGGFGICPYHGRRRSPGMKELKRISTGDSH